MGRLQVLRVQSKRNTQDNSGDGSGFRGCKNVIASLIGKQKHEGIP